MDPVQPSNEKKSRSRLYLRVALGLLYVMAFVWSIDASFVYILIGAIIIFVMLGLREGNGWQNFKIDPPFTKASDTYSHNKTNSYTESKSSRPTRVNKPLIVGIIAGFFVMFIIVTVIILSQGDDSTYEARADEENADYFYEQGSYDSAAMFYRKAFLADPENKEALTGYGNTFMMNNVYDSATFYYDKALSLDGTYEKANYQKGAVLSYQKNYEASIALLKNLLKANPEHGDALQLIGDNYYNQQRYDSALQWYDRAYDKGVRNRYLFHLMGYIHETKKDNAKAIKFYQEALQYDSSVLDIYQRLGDLLPGKQGDFYRREAATLEKRVSR